MAFFADQLDPEFRLGDIIDFRTAIALSSVDLAHSKKWQISLTPCRFVVILTPCCSIEREWMLVAPLEEIRLSFLENDYFAEDLLRINKLVPPEHHLPRQAWDRLDDAQRQERRMKGPDYVVREVFLYKPHVLLPSYKLKGRGGAETTQDHYLVNFKQAFPIQSPAISRNANCPAGLKMLELSAIARRDLREKLGNFYSRAAEEDVALLVS